MFAPPSRLSVAIRRLAAYTLVLWLAGAGCIIGCSGEVVGAAPADESPASIREDSCPAFSGHGCCHRAESTGDTASVRTLPKYPENIFRCPLAGQTADPARKVSSSDAPPALEAHGLWAAPEALISATLPASRLRVPDRGGTYLRCCVFLI